MENTLKNNRIFSNTVMKFCEIFMCPPCKQQEIKKIRLHFLPAPCTSANDVDNDNDEDNKFGNGYSDKDMTQEIT